MNSKEKIHQIKLYFSGCPCLSLCLCPSNICLIIFYLNDQPTNWTLGELVLLGYLVSGKFTYSSPISVHVKALNILSLPESEFESTRQKNFCNLDPPSQRSLCLNTGELSPSLMGRLHASPAKEGGFSVQNLPAICLLKFGHFL